MIQKKINSNLQFFLFDFKKPIMVKKSTPVKDRWKLPFRLLKQTVGFFCTSFI